MKPEFNFAFKDLKVWHKAIDFAEDLISVSENLNTNRKHFRLVEQIEAAATSISMNIAEGKGRDSKKEFVRFLYIARGSLYEVITLSIIFERRHWIDSETLYKIEKDGYEIASMIKGLINSIQKTY